MTREQRTRSRTDHAKANKAQESYRRLRQAFRLREKRSQGEVIDAVERHWAAICPALVVV